MSPRSFILPLLFILGLATPSVSLFGQTPGSRPSLRIADIMRLQEIGRLERELGVIKTTKTAWMEFDARQMFDPGGSLKPSARQILDKVLRYQALTDGSGMSVAYDFNSRSDSSQNGRVRSASVVNYLMGKSGLSIGWFTLPEPEPVNRPAVQSSGYPNQFQREDYSVVNIRIER